jgi:phosphoglycerol transferase MdoB-like AlkP superfamily enzyme
MKSRLYFLLSAGLFWLGFFFVFRFIFALYQWDITQEYPFGELAKAFLSGSRHDASLMGYVLMLTGLIVSATFFLPGNKLKKVFTIMYTIIAVLFASLLVPNLELYRNWGFHIDSTVLEYLKTPKEAAASTTTGVYLLVGFIFLGVIILSNFIIRKLVVPKLDKIEPIKWKWIPALLFVTAAMIIPVRGGFGIVPMNVGFVYFSNYTFANHLAVNPVWNFSYSMKKRDRDEVVFKYMDENKLQTTIKGLKTSEGESQKVISSERPNVIMIMLESFTSKATGLIEGGKQATPNLDKYAKEGIYFSNFYSIGDRSKIGIVGLLSGYPSLPRRSVIAYSRKVGNLPSLCGKFNDLGYKSAFYYGGDIRFANMNLYINTTGFGDLITVDNFDSELNESKWGVHDQYVFDYVLEDIKKEKDPFFKVFFTLSSHEPFDVPMDKVIKGDSEDSRFLNSIYYTDKCLGDFIEKLKKTEKWDNTVVVLVADHGTRYINKSQPSDFDKYHIPMVWIGGAVSAENMVVDKIGCQPDMSKTLLNQLNLNNDEFVFGKDLLNESQKGYAYFNFNNGFGYIDENERTVFDLTAKQYVKQEGQMQNNGNNWKAILQYLNEDFLQR